MNIQKFILSTVLFFSPCYAVEADLPAFPGAEGFGRFAMGGRGGQIIEVTNLSDSGPGSFREAVTASGPRIVVFKTGGTIELESRIQGKAQAIMAGTGY